MKNLFRRWKLCHFQQYCRKQYKAIYSREKKLDFLWLPRGANASACLYSLVETAKFNGLNPYKYLEFILSRLPGSNLKTSPKVLELMMPSDELIQKTCKS